VPSVSARGTRKEEFEYLTKMFSGTRVKKRPAPWEHKAIEVDEDVEGGVETSAHTKNLNVTQSPSKPKAEPEEKESRRGPGGKLRVPWKLPVYEANHRPLRSGKYGALFDVATWSVFKDSQDFAGNGIAALSSIPMDRDVLQSGGAVQYMVALMLTGKTHRSKLDACLACILLLKNDKACREFVQWSGFDNDGAKYTSGFNVALRLRRSKSYEVQRAGADLLQAVLLNHELKHSERITVEYIEGLCAYCQASDQEAAAKAAKILVAIFNKVHDTGIRWTVAPIQPVVDLLKNTEIFPKVRSFVLKALYVFAKEGDRVLGLISETGAVKTMTLQLAVRQNNKMGVDIDDLNYVRVLTQVCEVDSKRYQDVILIGGTKRIIQILRAHLVTHATLLSDEIEMQRRCMRFLERVISTPDLRFSAFEAGCAELYLDILDLEKGSVLKGQAIDCLSDLCEDPDVQIMWYTIGAEPCKRLAALLTGLSYNPEMQHSIFRILQHLCSSEETVRFLVATDMMDTTIHLLDQAVKNEDRHEMHEILAAGVQFLHALVAHELGRDHIALWNVVGRIDPNMRKVRGLLVTLECKEEIWGPYDEFLASLE